MSPDAITMENELASALDPFAFAPHLASRIIGLGGPEGAPDSDYVFHTAYTACEPGRHIFKIEFRNLRATHGTIVFRVNAAGSAEGISARTIKTITRSLRDLSYLDGEQFLDVETNGTSLYAVLGHIHGQSDASAEEMRIALMPARAMAEFGNQTAQQSVFGETSLKATQRLRSTHTPTLRDPVSQPLTIRQLGEEEFARGIQAIGLDREAPAQAWKSVFVQSVLRRYGLLREDARGIGLGLRDLRLASALQASGASVTPTIMPGTERGELPSELIELDPANTPKSLSRYDFCWSIDVFEESSSIEHKTRYLTDSLRCLHAGGLAIHTIAYGKGLNMLDQNTLERIVLDLVSLGHEVAQLSFVDDDELVTQLGGNGSVPFGLVLRKGRPPS